MFWTNKKFVYLICIKKLSWYIPSQNNRQKYRTKAHEQVFRPHFQLVFILMYVSSINFPQKILLEFDAAFNFGTRYSKKCQIPAHMLFKNVPNPLFYDLYIPYKSDTSNAGSSKKLHAIPIMILNKGGGNLRRYF
jgi:hypothetical protein